ncbi:MULTISPECIES: acyl-CoA dehydrogenase family protein [unclassified Sphingobium]|uniref:acyl-CoA dehydrogenase family protein n=1 Tax=unclassified Sphingobium TaxID=2611147 RepID=UPI0035A5B05F
MSSTDSTSALEAFRAEAREWIAANFPPSLKGRAAELALAHNAAAHAPDFPLWRSRVADRGWGAPTWPVAYGGAGLSQAEARVLQQEMIAAGAFSPMGEGLGLTMVGPTILEEGTEDQKLRHLPPIARGEQIWCLGYSEPNAGSDLAALQTRCEDRGDHWEVTGQKIWTSGANYADWCGALVRTDSTVAKHAGISFVLIAMHQPGVETRPIPLIGGSSPFCETFFTAVRVEKTDMLGPLNKGWGVGKRLLQHERASQMGEGVLNQIKPVPLPDIARSYRDFDAAGRLVDADLRARLTQHLLRAEAHQLTLDRVTAETRGETASNTASILKNSASEIAQARAELVVEIMGNRGIGWEGAGFAQAEIEAMRTLLGTKAMSIYGGTAEVQNNIVAKRILGLPETTTAG